MQYNSIVFLSDVSNNNPELEQIIEAEGFNSEKVLAYLTQWDCGESEDLSDDEPWGTDDETFKHGNYVVSYNSRLNYIGLTKLV